MSEAYDPKQILEAAMATEAAGIHVAITWPLKFAKSLRSYQQGLGLGDAELAERAGLAMDDLLPWLDGRGYPDDAQLDAIAGVVAAAIAKCDTEGPTPDADDVAMQWKFYIGEARDMATENLPRFDPPGA